MSNAIFPTLPGITWDTIKTPIFNTITKKAVSGRETRVAYMAAPMYSFKPVSYTHLTLPTILRV